MSSNSSMEPEFDQNIPWPSNISGYFNRGHLGFSDKVKDYKDCKVFIETDLIHILGWKDLVGNNS